MSGPRGETSLVERVLRVEAPAETVFEFFTDPEKVARWLGRGATLDPRPGGVFSVNNVGDYYVAGEFVEVEPPRRVVFTWGYSALPGEPVNPLPPGSSTVEVELVPDGDATVVRLAHRAPAGMAPLHEAGWDNYLPRLRVAAAGGTPARDRFHELFGSGRFQPR
jgi:uncharacterized protein YndB with AHSA1/START domain